MIFGGMRNALGDLAYLTTRSNVHANIHDCRFGELMGHSGGMVMRDNVPYGMWGCVSETIIHPTRLFGVRSSTTRPYRLRDQRR